VGDMKIKKGFTLIEILVVLFIFSIIVVVCLNFFTTNNKIYSKVSKDVDKHSNVRIALEFVSKKIRDGKTIVISDSGRKISVDSKYIYLNNNILRYDTDSQQIASGITDINFQEVNAEDGLYKIKITSNDYSLTTLIDKRE
jgi:prepilin-type N-terminal cleavage/methylation domain-containing protein